MTEEERQKAIAEAQLKLGRPFVTSFPVARTKDKSWRLREIEAQQKEEAKRRNVVSLKRENA